MDDQVTGKVGKGRKAAAQVTQPTTQVEVPTMATYKLVNNPNGSPSNYEMVDATVRNHKVKVLGSDGKPEMRDVPKEHMIKKVSVTGKDGKVIEVERPAYSRLIAIPHVEMRTPTADNPLTLDEVLGGIRALHDLIAQYDACDRVEAPDMPDGTPAANVRRVALIASQPSGETAMPTPEYIWNALCGAIRLDTQQNGQTVMRKRINAEIPAKLGWATPDKRVRKGKVVEATPDRFAGMAGGDDN